MPHNTQGKSDRPKGPYYDGRAHFSYNSDLSYSARPHPRNQSVQDMIQRAEQTMADYPFKGVQ